MINIRKELNLKDELYFLKENSKPFPHIVNLCESYLQKCTMYDSISLIESVIFDLSKHSYSNESVVLCGKLKSFYEKYFYQIGVELLYENFKNSRNSSYQNLAKKLESVRNADSKTIKECFKYELCNYMFIPSIKSVIEKINIEDKEIPQSYQYVIESPISPILANDDEYVFHLEGRNYSLNKKKKTLTSVIVKDSVYNILVEAMNQFVFDRNSVTYYNNNKKVSLVESNGVVYLEKEDKRIPFGIDAKNRMLNEKMFSLAHPSHLDAFATVGDNIKKYSTLDFVKKIQHKNNTNVKAFVIECEGEFWVVYINKIQKENSLVKYTMGSTMCKDVKDYTGYDLSDYMSNYSTVFDKTKQEVVDAIETIKDKIKHLQTERLKLDNTQISHLPQIQQAITFIDSEIENHTKEIKELAKRLNQSEREYFGL